MGNGSTRSGGETVGEGAPCFLDGVSVLILTYDEEANIGRALDALARFSDVVVLDSGSTDRTLDIVAAYANARVVVHAFAGHAAQWNHGLVSCGLTRPWILALDADYVVSPELVAEMAVLPIDTPASGYRVGFRYHVFGRPLSGTLYPASTILFRRDRAVYIQQGHTQRATIEGLILDLAGRVSHDDRKPLSRWLAAQTRYVALEAAYLLDSKGLGIGTAGRIRLMMGPAPILVFFYTLVVKRCALDGVAGWFYVLQRTLVEIMIALELIERRWRR